MKTTKLPTVDELNAAQAEWMALDSNGPKAEIDRVIKLYEATMPRAYLNVTENLTMAAPIIDSMPLWAQRQSMDATVKWVNDYNIAAWDSRKIRLDVAWCGSTGKWVAL